MKLSFQIDSNKKKKVAPNEKGATKRDSSNSLRKSRSPMENYNE